MDRFEPVGACSKETWDRVLDINLNGPFLTTKAAIAQFEKQEPAGGVIINICSTASIQSFVSGAAYTVSKAALAALTKNTAGFYGDKGIYCIGLLLGGMPTRTFTPPTSRSVSANKMTRLTLLSQGWPPISLMHLPRACTWRCSRRSKPPNHPPTHPK
jgi:NAD(P)-dependent dehydrogenase (short-subunit alcohol dehydrogenase family)